MGVQVRRTGFPVCGSTSWSADGLATYRGGGRNDWWHPKAIHALDFANIRAKRESAEVPLATAVTLTRGSAALLLDRTGVLRSFATSELALVATMGADFEGAFTNKLRNPRGEGGTLGIIGSGGVLPTNCSLPNAGVSTEFIGTGTDNNGAYQDWRLFGTASSSSWRLRFENTTNAAASVGQAWAHDFGVKLVAGTPVSVTPEIVVAAGSTVLSTLSGNTVTPSASVQTAKVAQVISDATANNVRPQFRANITNGSTYDFTIRLYAPKLCQVGVIEGPELATNGDFSSATGWTVNANWSIAGGVASAVGVTSSNTLVRSSAYTMTSGAIYKSVWTLQNISVAGGGIVASIGGTLGSALGSAGTVTDYIVCGASQSLAIRGVNASAVTADIDNFSVKLVIPGYLPSFGILPPVGTPGDSSRAADVAQTATFNWFGNAGLNTAGSELVAATFSHVADGVRRTLFEYSDGTSNNVICASINASDRAELSIVAGGVVQALVALSTPITSANYAFAFGWSAIGGYITNGVETQTFAAVTLPSVTQKRIGGGVTYPALNDLLRQVQACTLLTSAEAASWAASN